MDGRANGKLPRVSSRGDDWRGSASRCSRTLRLRVRAGVGNYHEGWPTNTQDHPKGALIGRPLVKRIDGARHWPRTLDQLVWLLLRAGVTTDQLTQALSASLRRHRKTRALAMPSPEVMEYGRVLTYWQHEPAYLDERGSPSILEVSRAARQALPPWCANPYQTLRRSEVLAVLSRHGLVSTAHKGGSECWPPRFCRAVNSAHSLSPTRYQASKELLTPAITNLTTRDPKNTYHAAYGSG